MIWLAVDRKPSEYLAALKMPAEEWHFFRQMDSFYEIKKAIEDKKQANNPQGK